MPKQNKNIQITVTATLTKTLTLPKHEGDEFTADQLDKEFDSLESKGWSLEDIEEVSRDEVDPEPRDE